MAIKDVARAYAAGRSASCHNAQTNGEVYILHGNCISWRDGTTYHFDWCGWYGPTTANHMNRILDAIGADKHVGYASARDNGVTTFEVVI